MILSFRENEAEKVLRRIVSRRLPTDIQRPAMKRLWVLDAAETLEDLRIAPVNHLEALHGDRKGQHSISNNQQWRVRFVWGPGGPKDVEVVDYH